MRKKNHPAHFIRDTFYFTMGNVVGFFFGYVQGFLIPKYLSIEHYAYWRWFSLFIGYLGLAHFGLPDGFLLRWVKSTDEEIQQEIGLATGSIILQQFILFLIGISIALWTFSEPHVLFLALTVILYMVIINLTTHFIFYHQALKKFKKLAGLLVINKFIFLVGLSVLLFTSWFSYQLVICVFLIAAIIHLIFLAWPARSHLRGKIPSLSSVIQYGRIHTKAGMILLFGNLMIVVFSSTDRLFITSFFSLHDFAMYSFAVTLVGIMYVLMRSVANVVFPYISNASDVQRKKAYELGKSTIIMLWAGTLGLYYLLQPVVESFLPDYQQSVLPMNILVSGLGFMAIIQIIHSNYYKISNMLRNYFIVGMVILFFLIALNLAVLAFFRTLPMIAIANVAAVFCWYIVNEIQLRHSVQEHYADILKIVIASLLYLAAFWLTPVFVHSWLYQIITYGICSVLISLLFFKNDLVQLIGMRKHFSRKSAEAVADQSQSPASY